MYIVTGANGQTGSQVMKSLLERQLPARALVRRQEQANAWREAGAEALVIDLADRRTLARAFAGGSGLYLMNPPAYAAPDIFGAAAAIHSAAIAAAECAEVPHIVALSSVGAQHDRDTGNILTTHDLEQRLARSRTASTILRAANFMENWVWSIQPVLETGILPSMFSPVARALPMVSAIDIGRNAADLLMRGPRGPNLIELHGPRDYSPNDVANILSRILNKPIRAVATPPCAWNEVFQEIGFSASATEAFCAMYRSFNDGLVAFSDRGKTVRGSVTLDDVLQTLMSRSAPSEGRIDVRPPPSSSDKCSEDPGSTAGEQEFPCEGEQHA